VASRRLREVLPVLHLDANLVDRMNEIVIEAGGRVYLTKDALTRREHFLAMEPRFAAWNEIRRKWDPNGQLRSAQSVRLFGDAP
jgi:FAD/FMN-containing dehydrogenase